MSKKKKASELATTRPAAAAPAVPPGPPAKLKKVTFEIDPRLYARFQAACALRGTTMIAELRRLLAKRVRRAAERWPHLDDLVKRGK